MNQIESRQPKGQLPGMQVSNPGAMPAVMQDYQRKFVDEYLRQRLYDLTDTNRAIVAQGIELYAGGELVMPDALTVFLDNLYRIHDV